MKLLTFKTSQGEAYRKRNAFATQNHPKLIWVIYRKQYCSTSSLSFDVWITLLTKKKVILGISTPALAEFSLPYRSLNKMQWEIRRGMMTEQYFTVTAQPCHSNVAGTRDMTTFITPWGFFATTDTHMITAHPAASLQAHVLGDSVDVIILSSATRKVQTLQRFSCEASHPWANLICNVAKD